MSTLSLPQQDSSFNILRFGANGYNIDTCTKIRVDNLTDATTYTLSFNVLNFEQGSISWNNVQLENGSTYSTYEPYFIISTTPVTINSDHVLKAIWEKA